MTARSDRDLTPESIVQKVSDASGSRYTGGGSVSNTAAPPPPVSSKPAFTPTHSSGGGAGFNPIAGSRVRSSVPRDTNVDEDGWGQDAPPVTRTQLEKVQPSYQPTKVNLRELSSEKPAASPSSVDWPNDSTSSSSDVVKGGYQPVGKVDIAALRKQAQEGHDYRPTPIKGSYEPIGKVDIAAIKARARQPSTENSSAPKNESPVNAGASSRGSDPAREMKSLPDRSAPFSTSERLTSLPKPKVANRFGSGTSSFTGTKAPTPGAFGLEAKPTPSAPPAGVGRTFADQGGKTPAQLWAEKKARERGLNEVGDHAPSGVRTPEPPIASQNSGEWKSGYGGKSWASVQTTKTGQSNYSLGQQRTGEENENLREVPSPAGGVGAIRDRFKDAPPMGAASSTTTAGPPPLDTSNKPNAGRRVPIPGLPGQPSQSSEAEQETPRIPTPPAQPPRSPTPPTPPAIDTGSPIRVAMPVGRGHNDQDVEDARKEQFPPPPSMPTQSLAQAIPHEDDLTEQSVGHDPARGAGEAAAATAFGDEAVEHAYPGAHASGKRALVQYDYEKAEDNELELRENEYVTNIEMVDDDWWMGQNPRGETGLFPSNYVELVGDEDEQAQHPPAGQPASEPQHHQPSDSNAAHGATATALYDYEAAEDNELSFPENATITDVVSCLSFACPALLMFHLGIPRRGLVVW